MGRRGGIAGRVGPVCDWIGPVIDRPYVSAACCAIRLSLSLLWPGALGAATATSLESFEAVEEPLVRYTPGQETFSPDAFVNITARDGVFRMELRYRGNEWDGDRDTLNRDRQRAEVKGLGPHQRLGETFEYATTWRTNPDFRAAGRFCHLFQLKSTDGDSGAPLVTLSLLEGADRAAVQYWPAGAKSAITVREFAWSPGQWQTVRLRITVATDPAGAVLASINGDAFQGVQEVPVCRPEGTDYRPKWGLYRGVTPDLPIADAYVEHRDVAATKSGEPAAADPAPLEPTMHWLAGGPPAGAWAWWRSQPTSPARASALATLAATWALTDPAAAMHAVEDWEGAEGVDARLRVFNRWCDRDPDAVLRWVGARPGSPELDNLLWYFATDTTLRYTRRERALAGAALMTDPAWRARAIEHVVLIWARREPQAAAQYVAGCSALDAAQKLALRHKISAARR
jgi:hypothetical protein